MLGANIKLLREEARLTKEELAEKVNISVEELTNIEKGKIIPDNKLLKQMCVYLRISVEDILERDIVEERNDAGRRMKHSSSRKDYNWYLGDKKKFIFYLSYLFVIPITFIIAYLILSPMKDVLIETLEMTNTKANLLILYYSYLAAAFPALIYLIIFIVKRFRIVFRWWYILIFSLIITIATILANILLIPGLIYSLYQVIIKKGRN